MVFLSTGWTRPVTASIAITCDPLPVAHPVTRTDGAHLHVLWVDRHAIAHGASHAAELIGVHRPLFQTIFGEGSQCPVVVYPASSVAPHHAARPAFETFAGSEFRSVRPVVASFLRSCLGRYSFVASLL